MVGIIQFLSHIWLAMDKTIMALLNQSGGPLMSQMGDPLSSGLLPAYVLDFLPMETMVEEERQVFYSQDTDFSSGAENARRFYSLSIVFGLYWTFLPLRHQQYSVSLDFVALLMFSLLGSTWRFCSRLHILCVAHLSEPQVQRHNFTVPLHTR